MHTAALAPALILAVVLVISGVAKLRSPRTVVASFRDLQVPAVLDRPALRAVFPWAEILLGVVLLILPRPLAPLAALLALALFAAYWALIYRALGFEEPVACNCFGEASAEPVTKWTIWRNTVLVGLAGWWLVASFFLSAPARLALTTGNDWSWILGGALACLVLWFALHRDAAPETEAPAGARVTGSGSPAGTGTLGARVTGASAAGTGAPDRAAAEDEPEADYLRTPIPPMLVQDARGGYVALTRLAASGARLVLYVSPGCGPCTQTMQDAVAWNRELGPVTVHLMVGTSREVLEGRADESLWENALYDVGGLAGEALGLYGTPSAVLLGADGMLAGGPVAGPQSIQEFVEQIREQLRDAPVAEPAGSEPTEPEVAGPGPDGSEATGAGSHRLGDPGPAHRDQSGQEQPDGEQARRGPEDRPSAS